jgi:hypothetical protein
VPRETDYVLRLIEQLAALVRRAMEKLALRQAEEPYEVAGEAIGLALTMEPTLASGLSPQTLVSLFELGNLDHRVIELAAQAIELEATALEERHQLGAAGFRRAQAEALRSLLEKSTLG